MNWYKLSQQQVMQQYHQNIAKPSIGVQITGVGANQMIQIPGGKNISAKDLLNMALNKIKPVLIQNHVHTIDTSPIGAPDAQGLSKSNTPGIIYVDVQKIFDLARMPLNGLQSDPNYANIVAEKISSLLLGELGETILHESRHNLNFTNLFQQNKPFSNETESDALNYGRQMRKKHFTENINQ